MLGSLGLQLTDLYFSLDLVHREDRLRLHLVLRMGVTCAHVNG